MVFLSANRQNFVNHRFKFQLQQLSYCTYFCSYLTLLSVVYNQKHRLIEQMLFTLFHCVISYNCLKFVTVKQACIHPKIIIIFLVNYHFIFSSRKLVDTLVDTFQESEIFPIVFNGASFCCFSPTIQALSSVVTSLQCIC